MLLISKDMAEGDMELIKEKECNNFVEKSFRSFIILKVCKTRNISCGILCAYCGLEFFVFCFFKKKKKKSDDRLCIGESSTNAKRKFGFMFCRKTIPLTINFACATRYILMKTNLPVSLIISLKFCRIHNC